MSILDIFRSSPTPQQTAQDASQQAATQAGTPVTQGTPGNIPPDTNVSHDPAIPPVEDPKKDDSPLAEFNSLWEPVAKGEGGEETDQIPVLTEEALAEVVGKADFTKTLTPELLSTITSGGEESAVALTQVLNAVARDSFSKAILASNKLTEQTVAKAVERQQADIPKLLRDQAATNHLNESNPVFQNPAIKPVIEATKSQLLEKYPNATSEDITRMTKDYILAMGEAFSDKPAAQEGTITGENVDWEAFLTAQ